jgi:magnesium chelatase family protein
MDRIDLVVTVDRPDPGRLLDRSRGTSSAELREVVMRTRLRALAVSGAVPGALSGARLLDACGLDTRTKTALEQAARLHHLSGRGITRLLRVARTLADLDEAEHVETNHVAEALGYRANERTEQ